MQTASNDPARHSMPSAYCPFCTDNIGSSLTRAKDSDNADAFSLSNLLPCGTITVSVHDGGSPCPSASNSGDWHLLPARNLSTHPADTLFWQLAFLTEHLFLRATCKLGPSGHIIFIRIYLVPVDLPNVRGRLYCRPEVVVKEARRHLRNVILLIGRNDGFWDADEACLGVPQKPLLSTRIDNRTMAEIYSDLPSPDLGPLMREEDTIHFHIASGGTIKGLRTSLYGYQRRSVAVMLYKESSTRPVPDPTLITVSCMSGMPIYIQPSTMTIFRECPMFSPPRAGILCEELGTGKTIMIIALVLASASQLADPEQSPVDERPAMTPLAYAHFPSGKYARARDRAGSERRVIQQVPSLVEVLVDYFSSAKATSACSSVIDGLEETHLWPLIQKNRPFYHHFDVDLASQARERTRRHLAPGNVYPRTMYLSSATLVIVPLTLLGQWKNEIDKHCYDNVRYLIVRPSIILPHARKLASDYELIVMSDTRFRKESKRDKIAKLYVLGPCGCPPLKGTRVPDCHCPGDPDVTPLFQVRWKRLVIDEGHIVGNMAATINHFVRKLSIQHRWIVTGTPTSNTLGLQLGRTTDEESIEPQAESDGSPSDHMQNESCRARIWGNYDSENLRKLGAMIKDFIAVPQFHADPKSFTFHVLTPLCDPYGPQPESISVLTQVMRAVMVRHRVEDVENDVFLPLIQHDVIYMELDDYARKSYNAMQAVVAINAVDSKREGSDYLFHPNRAKELQMTINKSSQGLFWSCAEDLYNVDEICKNTDHYMRRALKRAAKGKISPEDLDLLKQALEHAAVAADDQVWRSTQPFLGDVPFKVSGLDPAVLKAWTRRELRPRDASQITCFMHTDRLERLRSLVRKDPMISREELIKQGDAVEREEFLRTVTSEFTSLSETKHVNQAKRMAKEVQGAVQILKQRVIQMSVSEDEEAEGNPDMNASSREITSVEAAGICAISQSSHLSGVKVGFSLSTKLNYILSEIQQYSAKEKFLIFSNSLQTLSQISEALSLFEFKYLRYTNEVDYLLREQCVLTFETSDVYRVLLMDLKLGARGLNLISASRVIFCEPVWHPDVESQAIKRVHRIGQTRPVTVKTLVIRSTAEEAMIARRQYLRGSDKVPSSMVAEGGMRHYLQNPRFLPESTASNSIGLILSLDDNKVEESTSFQAGGEGNTNGISVEPEASNESEDLVKDPAVRKRVRFE